MSGTYTAASLAARASLVTAGVRDWRGDPGASAGTAVALLLRADVLGGPRSDGALAMWSVSVYAATAAEVLDALAPALDQLRAMAAAEAAEGEDDGAEVAPVVVGT